MSRDKETYSAASKYASNNCEGMPSTEPLSNAFVAGAEWADANQLTETKSALDLYRKTHEQLKIAVEALEVINTQKLLSLFIDDEKTVNHFFKPVDEALAKIEELKK